MAKKKNKKFKKSQPVVQEQPIAVAGKNDVTAISQNSAPEIKEKPKDDYDIDVLNAKYQPIRHDVFKLLIVLASLAVVFIAIYLVGAKTSILSTIGDWLYKVSNIQTQ